MGFNKKTYNLSSRYHYGATLDSVLEAFDEGTLDPVQGCLIPCGKKNDAIAMSHHIHRYRAAFRTQHPDDPKVDQYEGLKVTLHEDEEGEWFVKIVDRLEAAEDMILVDPRSNKEVGRITV